MQLPQAPWQVYLDEEAAPADPVGSFVVHFERTRIFLASVPFAKLEFSYARNKWSVKQVVGHFTDADLIFLYRLVCIARGETKALPSFDENDYVRKAGFDSARWVDILGAHRGIGESAVAIISGFDPEAWNRRGTANGASVSPSEMLRVWMGHERHHIRILKERYGIA